MHFKVIEYLACIHITDRDKGRNKFTLRLEPFLLVRIKMYLNFRLTKTKKFIHSRDMVFNGRITFMDKYNIVISNSKPNKQLSVKVSNFSETLVIESPQHVRVFYSSSYIMYVFSTSYP